jgi:regulator of sirC expression with transglutaminase-like and TPR domain
MRIEHGRALAAAPFSALPVREGFGRIAPADAMNPSFTSPGGKPLTQAERAALLTLLADDDPVVTAGVRARILSLGAEVVTWLKPHRLSEQPNLRRNVGEILTHFARLEADTRFLAYCLNHGDDLDLEEGVLLLAATRYPELNPAAYRALLDQYAAAVAEAAGSETRGVGLLERMNRVLFRVLGFRGDHEDYDALENHYFNRVLDRRRGNPINLCTLYWLIARRLRLPIVGVGMPSHFLCRYQTTTDSFFVDAFNQGRLLTRAHCVTYLQTSGYGFQESFLAPATSRETLLRMCANLHQHHARRQQAEPMAQFQRYLIALSKRHP